jgi:hypothetical protein
MTIDWESVWGEIEMKTIQARRRTQDHQHPKGRVEGSEICMF